MSNIKMKNLVIKYSAVALFLIIFDIIYEQFSHGVHANLMRYAFLVPLIALATALFVYRSSDLDELLLEIGSITLVVGFLLDGIVEIYGSTSAFSPYFIYLGITLLIGSFLLFLVKKMPCKRVIKS